MLPAWTLRARRNDTAASISGRPSRTDSNRGIRHSALPPAPCRARLPLSSAFPCSAFRLWYNRHDGRFGFESFAGKSVAERNALRREAVVWRASWRQRLSSASSSPAVAGAVRGSTVSLASPSPTVAALSRRQLTHYLTAVTAVLASKASPSKATFNPTRPAGLATIPRFGRSRIADGDAQATEAQGDRAATILAVRARSAFGCLRRRYPRVDDTLQGPSAAHAVRKVAGQLSIAQPRVLQELSQWDVTVAAQARHEHVKLPDALRHLISSAP